MNHKLIEKRIKELEEKDKKITKALAQLQSAALKLRDEIVAVKAAKDELERLLKEEDNYGSK